MPAPSTEELDRAGTYWIKWTQQVHFQAEVTSLVQTSGVSPKSKVLVLGPVIGPKGLLVSVGRIHRALPSAPVLLPSHSDLTRLIVLDQHERTFHAGVTFTLAEIRSSYWIVRGRQTVKRILNGCLVCK